MRVHDGEILLVPLSSCKLFTVLQSSCSSLLQCEIKHQQFGLRICRGQGMGRYGLKVNVKLGEGAFGVVYKKDSPSDAPFHAHHPIVAMKQIKVSSILITLSHASTPPHSGPDTQIRG